MLVIEFLRMRICKVEFRAEQGLIMHQAINNAGRFSAFCNQLQTVLVVHQPYVVPSASFSYIFCVRVLFSSLCMNTTFAMLV